MFQTVMKNDIKIMEMFSKYGTKDKTIFNNMKRPDLILRNAACVPIYPFLENTVIDDAKPKCFLVSGKCFRNEGSNVFELARLNEFYMKEYVFIGTPEQTKTYINKAKELWEYWADVFQLNCKVDTANDSFFASNYKKLRLFQILGDSKQEFRLLLPHKSDYLACSSANFHRTHFTKSYNIKNKSSYCYSSCFAFGVERLAYAFLSQKGIDIDKWDKTSSDELSKYIKL
jgi:seryl-tRNA synthetase